MLVESDVLEVGVVEEMLGVNVDGRLTLALTAQAPLRVHQTPELRTCTRKQGTMS